MLVVFGDGVVGVKISMLAAGCWLIAAGCWPGTASNEARLGHRISERIVVGRVRGSGLGSFNFDAGCWLLATGCRLLAAGCRPGIASK